MRFAYLIMAHINHEQLLKLLKLLDYSNNDIYLHIDKKSDCFNIKEIRDSIKLASIHIYKKYDVLWATMSQTECQVFLLNEAVKIYHDYYHLLSGQDLPIKSCEYIEKFFKKNNGVQFIHFDSPAMRHKESSRFYHIGNGWLEVLLVRIQRKVGFDRNICTGANWYSITHELAVDFCKNSRKALSAVRYTISSDECILQNFVKRISKNKYKMYREQSDGGYDTNMRLIDWDRGNGKSPYTWRSSDYEEIINSDRLFARKFDEKIDPDIIDRIVEFVT